MIDSKLHPGTSGSPVVNSPHNLLLQQDGKGGFHSSGTLLLGIHSAEHLMKGEALGLNVVWYAELLVEIAEQTNQAQ